MPVSATQQAFFPGAADLAGNLTSAEMPTVEHEEVTLREQNAKHFLLSDGTYTVAVYDAPVHYKRGNEWAEIDNSLVSASLVGEPLTGTIKRDTE